MDNGFRRIALAQGLLPEPPASDAAPRWTDAELTALLQIADPPPQTAPLAHDPQVPSPRHTPAPCRPDASSRP